MIRQSRHIRLLRLISISLALVLAVGPVSALPGASDEARAQDDEAGAGLGPLPPSLATPPGFTDQMRAGLSVNFFDCTLSGVVGSLSNVGTSTLQSGAGGAYGALSGGALGGAAVCPAIPDEARPPRCEDLQRGDGEFSMEALEAHLKAQDLGIGALSCHRSKLQAAGSQLQCLKGKADILAQQIRSLQSEYVNKIQMMQQFNESYIAYVQDRLQQQQEVKERFERLKEAQQLATNLLRAMPSQREEVQHLAQQATAARNQLQEFKESRTASLASECFETFKKPTYRCTPTSPPVSAKEYVLCRYHGNQFIGEGGVILQDEGTRQKADANRNSLEAVLANITTEAPTGIGPGAGGQQGSTIQSLGGSPVGVLSLADIEARFGDDLRSFNGNGIDVHAFVMEVMGSCYQKSERQVRREEQRKSTEMGVMAEQLKKAERDLSVKANEFFTDYSAVYAQVTEAMPAGNQEAMDFNSCRNAQPEIQIQCMRQAQNAIDQVLNHKPETVVIAGRTRGTELSFECAGLTQCGNKLERMHRNLGTEVQTREAERVAHVNNFNRQVEMYTQDMAARMNGVNADLQRKIGDLNGILAAAGVRGLIDTSDTVRGEELQRDQNGLVRPPNSVLDLIGAKMNPPMLNVDGQMFTRAMQGIGGRTVEFERRLSRLNQLKMETQVLGQSCSRREMNRLAESLRRSLMEWSSARCGYSQQYCMGGDQLSSLASSVDDIEPVGLDIDSIDSLRSGVRGMCAPDAEDRARAKQELVLAEDRLRRAKRDLASQQTEHDVCRSGENSQRCSETAALKGRAQQEVQRVEDEVAILRQQAGGGVGESRFMGGGDRCTMIYGDIAGKTSRIRSRSRELGGDSSSGRAM